VDRVDRTRDDEDMGKWRSPIRDLRRVVGYPLLAAIAVVCVVAFAVHIRSASAWIGLALVPLVLAVAWRVMSIGIYMNESGLLVVREFRTITVPWEQVAAIEVDSDRIVLHTRSGTEIRTDVRRGWVSSRYDFSLTLRPKTFDRVLTVLRSSHARHASEATSTQL
jgi:hypothetical protein